MRHDDSLQPPRFDPFLFANKGGAAASLPSINPRRLERQGKQQNAVGRLHPTPHPPLRDRSTAACPAVAGLDLRRKSRQ
ncbi:hypothetical protein EYE35_11285 [Cereibacter sphaeroides]|nr:hypothetical protein EYE35_11285 [Cereibacter sphaeroides]RAZ82113.1 hypothetical protein DDV93_20955 [Cereibacter johrii]